MINTLILLPVTGGITGWLIVSLALKVLFRPEKPVKLPWGDGYFQGLLPQKQELIAASVREIIETQLSLAVSQDNGVAPEIFGGLTDTVAAGVRHRTEQKIPAFLPGVVKAKIAGAVEDIVRKEAPKFIEAIIDNIRHNRNNERDICGIIEQKIRSVDLCSFENIILKTPEAMYLKIGAIAIGVLAGLIQMVTVIVFLT